MERMTKKIVLSGNLECITGLHIGGSSESIGIGDIDKSVIRVGLKGNQPYIPGSSLKGKIRSLLQKIYREEKELEYKDSPISNLFGSSENKEIGLKGGSSKIIFRDSYLSKDTVEKLINSSFTDLPFTEVKMETRIDRVLGKAANGSLRKIERIPAGAQFDISIVINVFEKDKDGSTLLSTLKKGVDLLNNDYLGGSGSRGYGQVFVNINWSAPEIVDFKSL